MKSVTKFQALLLVAAGATLLAASALAAPTNSRGPRLARLAEADTDEPLGLQDAEPHRAKLQSQSNNNNNYAASNGAPKRKAGRPEEQSEGDEEEEEGEDEGDNETAASDPLAQLANELNWRLRDEEGAAGGVDALRGLDTNIENAKLELTGEELMTAAGHHHHHKHYVHGKMEMGAHTGKKGAFGWHSKHPVGGKGR